MAPETTSTTLDDAYPPSAATFEQLIDRASAACRHDDDATFHRWCIATLAETYGLQVYDVEQQCLVTNHDADAWLVPGTTTPYRTPRAFHLGRLWLGICDPRNSDFTRRTQEQLQQRIDAALVGADHDAGQV